MEEQLIPIGFLLVFVGIIIIILGTILTSSKSKTKVEWGFGGFIGPIPFGFGSNQKIVYFIMMISLIIFILFFVLGKKLI